jgi:hypothetical protein
MIMMLAFIARQEELDMGQFITYLYLYLLPNIIVWLVRQAVPKDHTFFKVLLQRQAWTSRGRCRLVPCKRVKRYKKLVSIVPEGDRKANKLQPYLFLLAMASFRVGCHVELLSCQLCNCARVSLHLRALQGLKDVPQQSPLLINSDSFPIGANNHTSRCMANALHLFEDLRLAPMGKKVDGIGEGLEIKGTGTLVLCIQDDSGKHTHNSNPKQPLLTWFETVPPVTPTLGAGGKGNGK